MTKMNLNKNYLFGLELQMPFHSEGAIEFSAAIKKDFKIDEDCVYPIGDLYDLYNWSKYPKAAQAMSADQEIELNIHYTEKLAKIFPRMKFILGNHDLRIQKALGEVNIGANRMSAENVLRDLFRMPQGWKCLEHDWLVHPFFGEILVHHGNIKGVGKNYESSLKNLHASAICGHHHYDGGIVYRSFFGGRTRFFMYTGTLIDEKTYAAAYSKDNAPCEVKGNGVVYKGMPMFVPYITDKDGDWVGNL